MPSIEQVTRLSVLNASADSLGINQRAHDGIDRLPPRRHRPASASTAVAYSTIRPAIFSASSATTAPSSPDARWAMCLQTHCGDAAVVAFVAVVPYAPRMEPPATLLIWFQLRAPELAGDFERLMADDRDIVRGSLDTVSEWRLTRPADVPGQSIGQADYVLIAEIVEVERFEQQASELVERLADALADLVSSRGMLVVRPVI
jgi:hypothetical protein